MAAYHLRGIGGSAGERTTPVLAGHSGLLPGVPLDRLRSKLDAFVDRFATRVASFDRRAIATAKEIINQRTRLPEPADLAATQAKFFGGLRAA